MIQSRTYDQNWHSHQCPISIATKRLHPQKPKAIYFLITTSIIPLLSMAAGMPTQQKRRNQVELPASQYWGKGFLGHWHQPLSFPFQQWTVTLVLQAELAYSAETSSPVKFHELSTSFITCWCSYKYCFILTDGSREMIRTVLSARPTAKNRERCSPVGTLANDMQMMSADISLRSVYSLSWPV